MCFSALLPALLALGGCAATGTRREPPPLVSSSRESIPSPLVLCAGGVTTTTYLGPQLNDSAGWAEALISCNLLMDDSAAALLEIRVSESAAPQLDADWSPFMPLATCGADYAWPKSPTACNQGMIDTDYFKARNLCHSIQARIQIRGGAAVLSSLATTVSRPGTQLDTSTQISRSTRLHVPFATQKTDTPALAGRLCSPTSVTMVLRYYGADCTVQRIAALAYDQQHDIYGNWPRNVQVPATFGITSRLTRFNSLADAYTELNAGRPIIASIQVRKGELPEAPYHSTDGHLIVLTGFDEAGNFFVNDPAASNETEGRRLYLADHIRQVWLHNTNGTAYLLSPPMSAIR